jgi:MoaA/NifB/PqqE/SkfB family radical SAM enzyme
MGTLRKTKILKKIILNYFQFRLGYPKPLFCSYFITYRCNLNCIFCLLVADTDKKVVKSFRRYIQEISKEELPTEQSKYAIDQIAKLGISIVSFTGGEPLLRGDLEEIALYAKGKDMLCSLSTNGVLITPGRAKRLSCFNRIVVSLDGLKETHERIRGRGTFDKAMRGIQYLKEYSTSKVGIYFVINRLNHQDVRDVVYFTRDLCDFIVFQPLQYIDLFLNEDEAKKTQNILLRLKKENRYFIHNSEDYLHLFSQYLRGINSFECDAFDLYNALAPNGDLMGCSCYPYVVGNVVKEEARSIYRRIEKAKKELRNKCGGCSIGCHVQPSLLFRQPVLEAFLLKLSFLRFL